jgi:hypothetical protein
MLVFWKVFGVAKRREMQDLGNDAFNLIVSGLQS